MVTLIQIETLEYPIDLNTFYTRFINVSFARDFSNYEQFGYAIVYDSPLPDLNPFQTAIEDTPIFDEKNSKWIKKWKIVDKYETHIDEDGFQHTKMEYEQSLLINYRAKLKQDITDARYIKETSGYFDETLNALFDTSRDSVFALERLKNQALLNSDLEIQYKTKTGTWILFNAENIIRVYNCIFDFIQSCFNEEYLKHKEVDLNVTVL